MNVNVDRRFESLSEEHPIVCRKLHNFSDPSKGSFWACGPCFYFVGPGRLPVRLLKTKFEATPLKTETIPRLELLGNLL